jgi:hypothetical protein
MLVELRQRRSTEASRATNSGAVGVRGWYSASMVASKT